MPQWFEIQRSIHSARGCYQKAMHPATSKGNDFNAQQSVTGVRSHPFGGPPGNSLLKSATVWTTTCPAGLQQPGMAALFQAFQADMGPGLAGSSFWGSAVGGDLPKS
jgi:hypothetical protein